MRRKYRFAGGKSHSCSVDTSKQHSVLRLKSSGYTEICLIPALPATFSSFACATLICAKYVFKLNSLGQLEVGRIATQLSSTIPGSFPAPKQLRCLVTMLLVICFTSAARKVHLNVQTAVEQFRSPCCRSRHRLDALQGTLIEAHVMIPPCHPHRGSQPT